LTSDPGQTVSPVWSPDHQRLAYGGGINSEIRVVNASGVGTPETLLQVRPAFPLDWSRDGKYLLYQTVGDMWFLPMRSSSADRKPVFYLSGGGARKAQNGRFSPDGRLVAYTSDETGRDEVYVRPFPAASGKWPVSHGGGSQPRWRADGKELFFLDLDHNLMSVTVTSTPEFRASEQHRLFQTYQSVKDVNRQGFGYDVSADGRRFLVNSAAPSPAVSEINVVTNWQSAQR
jgi:Tol biopolymer transport system component